MTCSGRKHALMFLTLVFAFMTIFSAPAHGVRQLMDDGKTEFRQDDHTDLYSVKMARDGAWHTSSSARSDLSPVDGASTIRKNVDHLLADEQQAALGDRIKETEEDVNLNMQRLVSAQAATGAQTSEALRNASKTRASSVISGGIKPSPNTPPVLFLQSADPVSETEDEQDEQEAEQEDVDVEGDLLPMPSGNSSSGVEDRLRSRREASELQRRQRKAAVDARRRERRAEKRATAAVSEETAKTVMAFHDAFQKEKDEGVDGQSQSAEVGADADAAAVLSLGDTKASKIAKLIANGFSKMDTKRSQKGGADDSEKAATAGDVPRSIKEASPITRLASARADAVEAKRAAEVATRDLASAKQSAEQLASELSALTKQAAGAKLSEGENPIQPDDDNLNNTRQEEGAEIKAKRAELNRANALRDLKVREAQDKHHNMVNMYQNLLQAKKAFELSSATGLSSENLNQTTKQLEVNKTAKVPPRQGSLLADEDRDLQPLPEHQKEASFEQRDFIATSHKTPDHGRWVIVEGAPALEGKWHFQSIRDCNDTALYYGPCASTEADRHVRAFLPAEITSIPPRHESRPAYLLEMIRVGQLQTDKVVRRKQCLSGKVADWCNHLSGPNTKLAKDLDSLQDTWVAAAKQRLLAKQNLLNDLKHFESEKVEAPKRIPGYVEQLDRVDTLRKQIELLEHDYEVQAQNINEQLAKAHTQLTKSRREIGKGLLDAEWAEADAFDKWMHFATQLDVRYEKEKMERREARLKAKALEEEARVQAEHAKQARIRQVLDTPEGRRRHQAHLLARNGTLSSSWFDNGEEKEQLADRGQSNATADEDLTLFNQVEQNARKDELDRLVDLENQRLEGREERIREREDRARERDERARHKEELEAREAQEKAAQERALREREQKREEAKRAHQREREAVRRELEREKARAKVLEELNARSDKGLETVLRKRFADSWLTNQVASALFKSRAADINEQQRPKIEAREKALHARLERLGLTTARPEELAALLLDGEDEDQDPDSSGVTSDGLN